MGIGLGPMELAIVAIIALLLFGKRLPAVGRSLGQSITEFKRGMKDVSKDVEISGQSASPGGELPA